MADQPDNPRFWEALTRLERSVEGLAVHAETVDKELERNAEHLAKISDAQAAGSKTNWAVIFSGVSLIIGVGALIVSGLISDITRNEKHVEENVAHFLEHVRDGHPGRISDRVDINTERIKEMRALVDNIGDALDENLQREMRLLDIALQREMKLNDERLNDGIAAVGQLSEMRHEEQNRRLDDLKAETDAVSAEQRRRTSRVYTEGSAK